MKFFIIVCLILLLFCLVTKNTKSEHFSATDSSIDVEALQNLASMLTKDGEVKLSKLRVTDDVIFEKPNTHLGLQLLPIGTIIAWNGDKIPAGWKLCDGEGTPDLINKFIMGGEKNKSIGDSKDNIPYTTSVQPGHKHKFPSRWAHGKAKTSSRDFHRIIHTSKDDFNQLTDETLIEGEHSHTVNIDANIEKVLNRATLVFIIKFSNNTNDSYDSYDSNDTDDSGDSSSDDSENASILNNKRIPLSVVYVTEGLNDTCAITEKNYQCHGKQSTNIIGYILSDPISGITKPIYKAYSNRMTDSCVILENGLCHGAENNKSLLGHVLINPIPNVDMLELRSIYISRMGDTSIYTSPIGNSPQNVPHDGNHNNSILLGYIFKNNS